MNLSIYWCSFKFMNKFQIPDISMKFFCFTSVYAIVCNEIKFVQSKYHTMGHSRSQSVTTQIRFIGLLFFILVIPLEKGNNRVISWVCVCACYHSSSKEVGWPWNVKLKVTGFYSFKLKTINLRCIDCIMQRQGNILNFKWWYDPS